jgi:hypothetical protein
MREEEATHMMFTPSATSSFSAGVVFWGLVWATLGKLNELVHFLGFKKTNPREAALRWINAHKVVTITMTEAVNYSVHGISSPLGVTFALGGTLVNIFMVTFIVPIWCRLFKLENR